MKLTIDVPDVDGLPCEVWLTLGKTGYEPHVVSFYDPEDARTVFEKWWADKQREGEAGATTEEKGRLDHERDPTVLAVV